MELLSLFLVASMPVLKLLLLTALGSFLALDRIGILGPTARKNLNTVSSIFFLLDYSMKEHMIICDVLNCVYCIVSLDICLMIRLYIMFLVRQL